MTPDEAQFNRNSQLTTTHCIITHNAWSVISVKHKHFASGFFFPGCFTFTCILNLIPGQQMVIGLKPAKMQLNLTKFKQL